MIGKARLLVILIGSGIITTASGSLGALSLDTSRSATSVWRSEGEVDVLEHEADQH